VPEQQCASGLVIATTLKRAPLSLSLLIKLIPLCNPACQNPVQIAVIALPLFVVVAVRMQARS
jgi:hypothetical protein